VAVGAGADEGVDEGDRGLCGGGGSGKEGEGEQDGARKLAGMD
jgi:hypothetical protein